MKTSSKLLYLAGLLALLLISLSAEAATAPPVAPEQVCKNGTVDKLSLVARLIEADPLDPQEAIASLSNPSQLPQAEAAHPILYSVLGVTQNMLNNTYAPSFLGPARPGAPVQAAAFFAPGSSIAITCKVAAANTAPASPFSALSLQNVRVRGTPDDLIYSPKAPEYAAASKGNLSFSDSGASKTRTDLLQAAVGYALPLTDSMTLVPYVATNRNVSNPEGKPSKFTTEYADFGTDFVANFQAMGVPMTFNAQPDYLFNLIDNSRLASAHFSLLPLEVGYLNNYGNLGIITGACPPPATLQNCSSWPYVELIADIRSDFGIYSDRGSDPAVNQNYARLGTKFGGAIWLKNWVELTVTHTYMYGFSGARNSLNDFNSSLSFYFGEQNNLALTAGYQNGLLEQTAARQQLWTAGLTVKY